ncbi:hypothetical protein GCM10027059_44540 [Myceligenerans halotolerans]
MWRRFNLPWEGSDFAPERPELDGTSLMSVRWPELLKAAITVGREANYLHHPRTLSIADMVHRVSCMIAYFETDNDRLTPTVAFRNLDSTEQGNVSYYLGMALTSVWAKKIVRVPWLTHVSKMQKVHDVTFASKKRPDLLGLRLNGPKRGAAAGTDWLVAEAKGRKDVKQALLNNVRSQKSAVTAIDGHPPWLTVGCISHYRSDGVHLNVVDPEPDAEGLRWEVGALPFLAAYYAPIVNLFERFPRGTDQEGALQIAELPGTGVHVTARDDLLGKAVEIRELTRGTPVASWSEHVEWFTGEARLGYRERTSPDGIDVDFDALG